MPLFFQAARRSVVGALGLLWPSAAWAADPASVVGVSWVFWAASGGIGALLFTIAALLVRLRALGAKAAADARRLNLLLQNSNDGVVGLGPGMVVRFINPAARHMLGGVSRDVPFPWPDTIRFHNPQSRTPLDQYAGPLARALGGEQVYREAFDLDRRSGAGTKRRVQVTCADLNNDPSEASVVVTLTEKQSAQSAGQFGGGLGDPLTLGVMNDFNNALATIAYAIDLSLKHKLPEKPTSFLMTALGTVERGQRLTDQLLRQAQNADAGVAPCVLQPLFDEMGPSIRNDIGTKVALSFRCEDPVLTLQCDPREMEAVISAVVAERAEALSQSDHPGRVWVEARVAPPSKTLTRLALMQDKGTPFAEIVVADNGPPIGGDAVHVLTTPDTRDENASHVLQGALDQARAFALKEGGDTRVISNGAEGVAISLVLPGQPADALVQPIWRSKAERGEGETVFIVEDEASLLMLMQEELEELGYRVISATSGAAALGLIEQGVEFDLVITDVVLPGEINGFDLAARIRELRHGAAVLYMSGYHGFDSSDMGAAKAPILKKPASPYELAMAVKLALANRLH